MKKDTLIEVVDKLTGVCYPYGDTSIDEERYENLQLKITLVAHLLNHIEQAGKLYNKSEFSIQHISNRANGFLADIRDMLLDIEYLPSFKPIDNEVER